MKYTYENQSARKKYLEGEPLSAKEQASIDRDLFGSDYRFFLSPAEGLLLPEKYNAESTFHRISKRIKTNRRPGGKRFRQAIAAAAAILLLVLGSAVSYRYLTAPALLAESTSYGEKKEVRLPDGSKVMLNSLSSISYPERMTGKTREVTMKGEVYFDIARDPEKAFIVKVKEIEVKVLGTKFNIDAYDNEENITTTLFEGSVSVSKRDAKPKLLQPGEQAVFGKKTGSLETARASDPNIPAAWRSNILAFENERFSDILQTLSREYNVTFEIEDEVLKALRITARFHTNETINEALDILSQSAAFTYSREGNQYKIEARKE